MAEVKGLDEAMAPVDRTITLLVGPAQHPHPVSVTRLVALSKLARTALEQDPTATTLPLASVSPDVLGPLQTYLDYHEGPAPLIPYPAKSKEMKDNCADPWDAAFVDRLWGEDRTRFYHLMSAANYLDVACLLHLLCCKVGTVIQGTPHDQIRDLLLPPAS